MNKDRFDLEQQIMDCWSVVDDINTVYEYFGDHPDMAGCPAKVEDEMMNLLLGMKTMYQVKFDKLFRIFEQLVHQGEFKTQYEVNAHIAAPGELVMYDAFATKYKFEKDPNYPMDLDENGFTRGTLYRMKND